MDNEVLVALIAAAGSFLGTLVVSWRKNRDVEIKEAQREQRQEDRMSSIEKKLDEHNGYARRFGEIERSLTAIQKDVEYLRKK